MINISNSIMKVFRDEQDKYFTFLSGEIFNVEKKEPETKFYTKRKIRFANGLEVKNKSKIEVIEGYVMPYKYKIVGEDGEYKAISGEVFYIKSFNLLEDGIDERQKPFKLREPKPKKEKPQKTEKIDKNEAKLNSFSFNEYGNVTPF